MATKMLQGVTPLIKVCKDPLPEYDNWNFTRGYTTEISLPLGLTQLYSSLNHSIILFIFTPLSLRIATGWGGSIIPSPSFSPLIFRNV